METAATAVPVVAGSAVAGGVGNLQKRVQKV